GAEVSLLYSPRLLYSLSYCLPPPTRSTRCPYTTLFRSIGAGIDGAISTHFWNLVWGNRIGNQGTCPGLGKLPGAFFEDELHIFSGLRWLFWDGEVHRGQHGIRRVTRNDWVYYLKVSA